MSTESHNQGHDAGEPRHTDVAFEERDVEARSIYGYLLALGLATAAALLICVFILRFTLNYAASSQTPPPPSREAHQREWPPEPRLQGVPGHTTDPQQDWRDKLKADTEANQKFAWIDESSGIAQIPVKDAMKIIVEKGLPGASASATEKKK
jgi:Spy/CpxP family protein refolding chaperone